MTGLRIPIRQALSSALSPWTLSYGKAGGCMVELSFIIEPRRPLFRSRVSGPERRCAGKTILIPSDPVPPRVIV